MKKTFLIFLGIFLISFISAPPVPDPFGDYDGDGVINKDDNCYFVYNPLQWDADMDEIGDVCDPSPFGYCGDGLCIGNENFETCPLDCEDGEPVCGNEIKEQGEECDGNDFGSLTCQDFGFSYGELLCSSSCEIETLECYDSEFPERMLGHRSKFVQFCEPNWQCSGWSECDNEIMKRECYDANFCEYSYNKPSEVAGCDTLENALVEEETLSINAGLLFGILIAVLLIVVFVVVLMRRG